MSDWLKEALRTALDRDPIAVLNDLEILNTVLHPRAQAHAQRSLMAAAHEERG